MKILTLGDVVGRQAVAHLEKNLWNARSSYGADIVIVNGENASDIYGIDECDAKALLSAGADVITLGNHAFGKKNIFTMLSDSNAIIRPANYPPLTPGGGYTIINVCGWRVLCINVLGTVMMESLACPFATVDKILEREKGNYDVSIMDLHAESTSEKIAIGRYFDGRINVIFGTHTHVQTADEQILPHGSGYITDLGMTGPVNSVIGSDVDAVIERMRTKITSRFTVADGEIRAHGALFDLDTDTKKVISVKRIVF
jgi:metallophosphoesterase (TIGR00282 family)